ncbi:hypothetical protein C8R45DRAFT_938795 [Mycena sanguinolenta]|nr:hypothetical protein C8R45DRAFT_938795 [Mycena sanguinolenta]
MASNDYGRSEETVSVLPVPGGRGVCIEFASAYTIKLSSESAATVFSAVHVGGQWQWSVVGKPVMKGNGKEASDDGNRRSSYSGRAWCKRAQVKPRHKPSRPSPYSQFQTPLSRASRFGKPIG